MAAAASEEPIVRSVQGSPAERVAMTASFLLLLLLLLLILAFSSIAPVASDLPQEEIAALLTLKASWADPNKELSSWTVSISSSSSNSSSSASAPAPAPAPAPASASASACGLWRGVECDSANSRVIGLSLSKIRLEGTLGDAIGSLAALQTLAMVGTKLWGSLPPRMAGLSALRSLDLARNAFSGPISGAIISNLTSLTSLCLDHNNFSGPIPAEPWPLLAELRTLRLRSNSLSGSLPASLFLPGSALRYLLLDSNLISGSIPGSIANLTRLVYLSAASNSLVGPIPDSVSRLPELAAVYLAFNALEGPIPPSIGGLSSLVYLDLSGNRLSGPLPQGLSLLPSLKLLNLSDNRLEGGVPPSLGNLSSLAELGLSNNNLSGEVPTAGALGRFSDASFAGNPELCGGPLPRQCIIIEPFPPPSPSPSPPPRPSPSQSPATALLPNASGNPDSDDSGRVKAIVSSVAVGGLGLCIVLVLLVVLFLRQRARREDAARTSPDGFYPASDSAADSAADADADADADAANGGGKLEMFARAFKYSYEEVVSHAGYYDTAHVVGKGRFATVFRSDLPDGASLAVKVLRRGAAISGAAFEREMVGLDAAAGRFYTLLPIRGFYSGASEKAILYSFMPKGTLHELLHGGASGAAAAAASLGWGKRLRIAIGIAHAVAHLHRGSSATILHKDLKSSNVLLLAEEEQEEEEEGGWLLPLVADYGLIGLVSEGPVAETPGYAAPELLASRRYTEKTDVYSFGVVLLELLTGKRPVSHLGGGRELRLVTWVTRLWRDRRGPEALCSHLVAAGPGPERALGLAVQCLADHPAQRPSISEAARFLEGLADPRSPIVLSPCFRPDQPLLPPSLP